MVLDLVEFVRRFLQYVLPTGFMKVRYFGFVDPNCKVELGTISTLITEAAEGDLPLPKIEQKPWKYIACPHCGGNLKLWDIFRQGSQRSGLGSKRMCNPELRYSTFTVPC